MKVNWPLTLFLYFILSVLAYLFTVLTYGTWGGSSILALTSAEARILLFLIIANFFASTLRPRHKFWSLAVWGAAILITAYQIVSLILFQLTRISIAHNLAMLVAGGQGVQATLETIGSVTVSAVLIDFCLVSLAVGTIGYLILFTEKKLHTPDGRIGRRPVILLSIALFTFVVVEQAVSYYYKKPSLWRVEQNNFSFYPDIVKPDLARETSALRYSVTLLPPPAMEESVSGKSLLEKSARGKALPIKSVKIRNANVFLFIVESFAKRFVSQETTPHLMEFAKGSLAFNQSLAGANGTHHAWYSILTSDFPVRFLERTKSNEWKGSPALRVLKDKGFTLKVFDSAGFSYLNYDHIILGDIFSSTEIFSPPAQIQSQWDKTDVWAGGQLADAVSHLDKKGHNFYISFPGATHFPYFSGKSEGPEEIIDYFRLLYSPTAREVLPRRYRKAAAFFDEEFARFIKALKDKGLYEDAIIIVTGDHGEELMEKKALGHGSSLIQEQISTPIFIKIPGVRPTAAADVISELDILPTVFEALGMADQIPVAQMAGRSRLKFQQESFSLTSSVNRFRDNPTDFMISDGHAKVHFVLDTQAKTFKATTLTLREITDMNDEPLPVMEQTDLQKRQFFETKFAPALTAMGLLTFDKRL
jgi:hypothetical protein